MQGLRSIAPTRLPASPVHTVVVARGVILRPPLLPVWHSRPRAAGASQAGCETLIAVDSRPAGVFTPEHPGVGCWVLPAELRAEPALLDPLAPPGSFPLHSTWSFGRAFPCPNISQA